MGVSERFGKVFPTQKADRGQLIKPRESYPAIFSHSSRDNRNHPEIIRATSLLYLFIIKLKYTCILIFRFFSSFKIL